jgi:hypothetical protein
MVHLCMDHSNTQVHHKYMVVGPCRFLFISYILQKSLRSTCEYVCAVCVHLVCAVCVRLVCAVCVRLVRAVCVHVQRRLFLFLTSWKRSCRTRISTDMHPEDIYKY